MVTDSLSLRQTLKEHFPKLGELPLSGGWGYDQESAIVIDKFDATVDRSDPFNGVALEYLIVEKRLYEELIIQRETGDAYSDIRWKQVKQSVVEKDGRRWDLLEYDVTAFHDTDWDSLKNEWEESDAFLDDPEGERRHQQKRDALQVRFSTVYWFEITSFFGVDPYVPSADDNDTAEYSDVGANDALVQRLKTVSREDLEAMRDTEDNPEFIKAIDQVLKSNAPEHSSSEKPEPKIRVEGLYQPEHDSQDRQFRFATLTWCVLALLGVAGYRQIFHTLYPFELITFTDLHVYLAIESFGVFLTVFLAIGVTFFLIYPKASLRSNLKSILVIGSLYCIQHLYSAAEDMALIPDELNSLLIFAGPLGAWGLASMLTIALAKATKRVESEPPFSHKLWLFSMLLILSSATLVTVGLNSWEEGSASLTSNSPQALQETPTTEHVSKEPIANDEAFVIHPVCLNAMFFADKDFDIKQPINCSPDLSESPLERDEWTHDGKSYVRYTADLPRIEDGGYAGFVSYEVYRKLLVGDSSTAWFMTITFNGGGSGHFGTLAMLLEESNGDLFIGWYRGTGDRCNDGYPIIKSISPEGLIYTTAATPFRLINPFDDENWRSKRLSNLLLPTEDVDSHLLGGWMPYDDISNSAMSCAGERIYNLDLTTLEPKLIGVQIDPARWLDQDQGRVQPCVNRWLLSLNEINPEGFKSKINLEDWVNELTILEEVCE